MHRGEQFAWILLGLITATLVLMGTAIHTYEYLGQRRVEECRADVRDQGFDPGTDAWSRCDESGDWGGN